MILVFGSINVDVLMALPHLPQPGETVLGIEYSVLPGGKGANQALAASRAGASVTLAGAVGDDGFAGIALERLRHYGVALDSVRQVPFATGCATIMIRPDGENLIAVAPGANATVTAAQIPADAIGPATIVVCQMEVPAVQSWALLQRARAAGARTILNLAPAAPVPPAVFADIDILVANRGEAETLGVDPLVLARRLRQAAVVTDGAAGAIAYLPDGDRIDVPALEIEPVDTTGAGDAFVGVLAAGLDAGLALAVALRRASAAGGLACLATGAQSAMPDRAAIDAAVQRLP